MNNKLNLKSSNFPITLNSIKHLIRLIYKNKSPVRIFHNYFLKKIEIKGKTIDLGSGNHSSYLNHLTDNTKYISVLRGLISSDGFHHMVARYLCLQSFSFFYHKYSRQRLLHMIRYYVNYQNQNEYSLKEEVVQGSYHDVVWLLHIDNVKFKFKKINSRFYLFIK